MYSRFRGGNRVSVTVLHHGSGPPGRMDVVVAVPELWSPNTDGPKEFYFNLYVSDLRSGNSSWAPRDPITHPEVSSLKAPFTRTLRNLTFQHGYVGILVSVCNAFHQEIDWHCRVYRTSDGAEVRDCRNPLSARWKRRTG